MSSPNKTTDPRIHLLRQVLELLMWELSALRERHWEELPNLNTQKKTLITRMAEFDWAPAPSDRDNFDLVLLKSQIRDLEYQVGQTIRSSLDILRSQFDDLKRRQTSWRRALEPYRHNGSLTGGGPCSALF